MPYNLLTLFKYLYNKHWRFYFLTCTTCIVYQYFKELVASVSKAGAKVSGLFLTAKLFWKFFQFFLLNLFLRLSMRKGKKYWTRKRVNRATCESDCKDKDFYLYPPNFSGSFFVLILRRVRAFYSKSLFQGSPLLESGCKSSRFYLTLQIYHPLFFIYFRRSMVTRWTVGML